MKKFEEFNKVNESFTQKFPIVHNPEGFGEKETKLFLGQQKNGLTPYFLNDEFNFQEVLFTKEGFPYKEYETETKNRYGRPLGKKNRKSLKYEKNPYGTIYFMNEEDVTELTPLTKEVKKVLDLMKQKEQMLTDLIGSKLYYKYNDEQNDEDK